MVRDGVDAIVEVPRDRWAPDVLCDPDPAALTSHSPDSDRAGEAIAELARSEVGIASFSLGQPSLDEVFLALTGHTAEDHTDGKGEVREEQAA